MPANPAPDLGVYEVLCSALREYPGNPRSSNVEALAESLKVNGQYRPIVVRKETREILAGNHTWKAAQSLGWEKLKVTFVEGLNDEQALRIVLADNRYSDLAEYSVPDLTELLDSLTDLRGTGYDKYTQVNLEAAFTYEPPTPPERAQEAPGAPTGTLANEDALRQPQVLTCPNCQHVWEK